MRSLVWIVMVGAGLSTGCATTSAVSSRRDVDSMVRERVGVSPRLESDPGAGRSVAATTGQLLDRPLDAMRAVELALLNNASLHARVEELGLAHAELVQAGLVSNPRAHASFRFPAGGGAEGTGSEAGI